MNISKSQYKSLLMLTYCGDWVINSHKTKVDKIQSETEKAEQYIFSFAKEFGFENLVEYDEDLNMYFPTAEMEDNFHGLIDKYDLKKK